VCKPAAHQIYRPIRRWVWRTIISSSLVGITHAETRLARNREKSGTSHTSTYFPWCPDPFRIQVRAGIVLGNKKAAMVVLIAITAMFTLNAQGLAGTLIFSVLGCFLVVRFSLVASTFWYFTLLIEDSPYNSSSLGLVLRLRLSCTCTTGGDCPLCLPFFARRPPAPRAFAP